MLCKIPLRHCFRVHGSCQDTKTMHNIVHAYFTYLRKKIDNRNGCILYRVGPQSIKKMLCVKAVHFHLAPVPNHQSTTQKTSILRTPSLTCLACGCVRETCVRGRRNGRGSVTVAAPRRAYLALAPSAEFTETGSVLRCKQCKQCSI